MSPALYANAAALSGLVAWYGVLVLLDRGGHRRWQQPLMPLLAGGLSFRVLGAYMAAVHPAVLPYLDPLTGKEPLLRFVIDVGIREESIKLLLALPCLLWLQSRTSSQSVLLAAAMVGLGFATVENRWFFRAHAEPTLLVGRVFSTTALHLACTGLCGAALIRAWQARHPQAWGRFMLLFLTIAAAHGLYDWAPASGMSWLHTGGTSWLSQLVVIALMAWLFVIYRRTQPEAAPVGPSARTWLLISALAQYALALGLTWTHWHTLSAVWTCARECVLFLPVLLLTAILFSYSFATRRQSYIKN